MVQGVCSCTRLYTHSWKRRVSGCILCQLCYGLCFHLQGFLSLYVLFGNKHLTMAHLGRNRSQHNFITWVDLCTAPVTGATVLLCLLNIFDTSHPAFKAFLDKTSARTFQKHLTHSRLTNSFFSVLREAFFLFKMFTAPWGNKDTGKEIMGLGRPHQ